VRRDAAAPRRFKKSLSFVMPGLVPGIHVLEGRNWKDADGRYTLREDALCAFARP
jgi:hypothetical protein